ncbi:MAG: two-component sensor histidine kinase [Gemmataceae bacterium]
MTHSAISHEPTTSSATPATEAQEPYLELAELAGRFIHDIKNHLGTLSLNAQLLLEELDSQAQTPALRRAYERAARMHRECLRLSDLANNFLRYARLGQIHLQPTDLHELLVETVEFFLPTARQAGVQIKTFLPANLPVLPLDRELFRQAVINVLLNAAQAMPEGGELTIQAEVRPDTVLLSFIDTGVGMTHDVLQQIFKPFFTTRPNGSGLGLPTTRRIVEAHGGHVEVQSEPGRGTKFTMFLPIPRQLAGATSGDRKADSDISR